MNPTASGSGRPPSVQSNSNRASSAQSLYSSTNLIPKTPRLTSSRHGTLSAVEVTKISNTIASARQTTTLRRSRQAEITAETRSNPIASGSILAESSFVNAPLNSRLPPISPRRYSNGKSTSRVNAERITKAFSSSIPPGDGYYSGSDDDDDLIFEEDLGRKRREGLEKESLEGLSVALQEAFITEDLLSVLSGIEGQYIEYALDYAPEDVNERLEGARFVIDPLLDPSLTSLVTRLLPLAAHYISLIAFLSEYTTLPSGVTNHALGAAIRESLREYLILLANLEQQFNTSPTFTLQRLWFYINPTLHTMSLLNQLTNELIETSIPPPVDSDSEESDTDGGKFGGEGLKAALAGMMGKPVWESGIVKGGEILAIISERMKKTSGDPVALELYSNLLLQASQPYLGILLRWIRTGELIDLYGEFMVVENFGINQKGQEEDYTDEYWETRYTLRDSNARKGTEKPRERGLSGGAVIPDFLEVWKNKILLAGKYLNVIRECGRATEARNIVNREEEWIKMDDDGFYKQIDEAYTYANKTLLHLLIDDEHLIDRLRSVKSYFFLQPPLFTSFLASATYELKKRVAHVSVSKLQSLLDVALRTDGGEEELKVRLEKTTVVDFLLQVVAVNGSMSEGLAQASGKDDNEGTTAAEKEKAKGKGKAAAEKNPLTGTTALSISMNIPFPLSLILSKQTTLRYQILFRHLLSLRTLSQLLANNWSTHHKSPIWRTIPSALENWEELNQFKRRIFSVRMRMAGWIGAIEGFVVGEVLESGWMKLEKKLEKCETVDELLRDHVDFLDSCLKGSLLTDKKLLELHAKIMQTCTLFTSYINHFENYIKVAVTAAMKAEGAFEKVDLTAAWEFLARFEGNFNHSANIYLERVTFHAGRENSSILPLMVRLTYLRIPETAKNVKK